jgi:hypothetical protein
VAGIDRLCGVCGHLTFRRVDLPVDIVHPAEDRAKGQRDGTTIMCPNTIIEKLSSFA